MLCTTSHSQVCTPSVLRPCKCEGVKKCGFEYLKRGDDYLEFTARGDSAVGQALRPYEVQIRTSASVHTFRGEVMKKCGDKPARLMNDCAGGRRCLERAGAWRAGNPAHNPTHNAGGLVCLTGILAVPALL
jgi:hypothetical protein